MHCTKGTYVRTLVEDIGKKLGCGGHVAALRRLEVGAFKQHEQVSYPQLQETLEKEGLYALDKYILPVEELLKNLPALAISEAVSLFAKQGKSIRAPNAIQSQYVKIMLNNRLFGVGEVYQEDNSQMVKLIKQNTN